MTKYISVDIAVEMTEDYLTETFEGDTPPEVRYQIAARIAPELLEALEKASDFIHDALPDNPEYKELAKTIRAILDKAEK